ncbi:hypothetical protein GLOIN_2v1566426, partial [Rhizophagus irregularis DAOM 181602=DAOM 197198]
KQKHYNDATDSVQMTNVKEMTPYYLPILRYEVRISPRIKSFKLIATARGTRKLIGYFEKWDDLLRS